MMAMDEVLRSIVRDELASVLEEKLPAALARAAPQQLEFITREEARHLAGNCSDGLIKKAISSGRLRQYTGLSNRKKLLRKDEFVALIQEDEAQAEAAKTLTPQEHAAQLLQRKPKKGKG